MIKLLMSQGFSRNEAVVCANACGADMSHALLTFFLVLDPQARRIVEAAMPHALSGGTVTFTTGGIDG